MKFEARYNVNRQSHIICNVATGVHVGGFVFASAADAISAARLATDVYAMAQRNLQDEIARLLNLPVSSGY